MSRAVEVNHKVLFSIATAVLQFEIIFAGIHNKKLSHWSTYDNFGTD